MIEPLLHAERLLLHGQIDAAERIYAQTAASDPRNAIAVVGLARVAIERGDDALAYRHACVALEIDAHNVAALRLEARLSEVMAARGEEVARPPSLAPQESRPMPAPQEQAAATSAPTAATGTEAEQAAFARNPSMAEHRARMEEPRHGAPAPSAAGRPAPPRRRRLLRR
ncbi:MAG: hypothetical protein M3N29_06595, partial [Chloroflexota bacterium]|nr:hypothetical protein [Chloroflexota bacterium]